MSVCAVTFRYRPEVEMLIEVTLRNVATIIEEADTYAAEQLKDACLDYCAINAEALLENRYSEKVDFLTVDSWTTWIPS